MRLVFHKPYNIATDEELAFVPVSLTRGRQNFFKARKTALAALDKLAAAAKEQGVSVLVISAHRTREPRPRSRMYLPVNCAPPRDAVDRAKLKQSG